MSAPAEKAKRGRPPGRPLVLPPSLEELHAEAARNLAYWKEKAAMEDQPLKRAHYGGLALAWEKEEAVRFRRMGGRRLS
jgi:hypothetical protein